MSGREFLSHCITSYTFRITSIMCCVGLIWFATNLSTIDEGDSYKEAFKPLWFAEASLGLMGLAIWIGIALFKCDSEQFIDQSQPFHDANFGSDDSDMLNLFIGLAQIWVVCLSVSSVLLPYKLDDDDSFSWNEIFAPYVDTLVHSIDETTNCSTTRIGRRDIQFLCGYVNMLMVRRKPLRY